MKYTIEGFSQAEAVRLELDIKDLVLLRWLVDFQSTGKMEMHLFDGVPYYWINYMTAAAELPILGISSTKVMGRRFKHLADAGAIEMRCFEAAGNKTYFRFRGEAMSALISDREKQAIFFADIPHKRGSALKSTNPPQHGTGYAPKSTEGMHPKVPRVCTQKYRPIDSSTIDSSISDSKSSGQKPAGLLDLPYPEPTEAEKLRLDDLARTIGYGFNVFRFMAAVRNAKGYPPPPKVMIHACERFIADDSILNPWGWFVKVVKAESGQFFANLNIEEHQRHKKEPANIGHVMREMGVTR